MEIPIIRTTCDSEGRYYQTIKANIEEWKTFYRSGIRKDVVEIKN